MLISVGAKLTYKRGNPTDYGNNKCVVFGRGPGPNSIRIVESFASWDDSQTILVMFSTASTFGRITSTSHPWQGPPRHRQAPMDVTLEQEPGAIETVLSVSAMAGVLKSCLGTHNHFELLIPTIMIQGPLTHNQIPTMVSVF